MLSTVLQAIRSEQIPAAVRGGSGGVWESGARRVSKATQLDQGSSIGAFMIRIGFWRVLIA